MRIRVIITGGTIDKSYEPVPGDLACRETHMREILGRVRCTVPVDIEVNRMIDSLEMTDADREAVLGSVQACQESRVVVTHGTDTMVETASVVGRAQLAKTVVFTGAMVPYVVRDSDALFNLGVAFAAAQTLPAGVYIAMNGRVFAWDNARKNRIRGVFETLDVALEHLTEA